AARTETAFDDLPDPGVVLDEQNVGHRLDGLPSRCPSHPSMKHPQRTVARRRLSFRRPRPISRAPSAEAASEATCPPVRGRDTAGLVTGAAAAARGVSAGRAAATDSRIDGVPVAEEPAVVKA